MIFVKKQSISEAGFVQLLENTKTSALNDLRENVALKTMNGDQFELFIYRWMVKLAEGTEFDSLIEQTGTHGFPDIIANGYFGVEVKVTKDDKWKSTGNSILETTRVTDVKKIFLFFGKLGGTPDIKYRLYQECLYDIGVTHSPRYKINMELELGKSIFEKMGIEYEALRMKENPIQIIKEHFRKELKEGQELWWIDPQDEKISSPIIRSLDDFSSEEKEKFIAEVMILFPEIFGKNQSKFERVAAYLITEYNAVSSHLRDIFTAGGQVDIKIGNDTLKVPRIFDKLFQNAKGIKECLENIEEEKIQYFWKTEKAIPDRVEFWKTLLQAESLKSGVTHAVEIYEEGIK